MYGALTASLNLQRGIKEQAKQIKKETKKGE